MPLSPSCLCGSCAKCKNREKQRRFRARNPEANRAIQRAWRDRNRERYRELHRTLVPAYRERNPDKVAAWDSVKRAIRAGELVRETCSICGDPADAHHEDYARPLDVVWLCRAHHKQRHVEMANA